MVFKWTAESPGGVGFGARWREPSAGAERGDFEIVGYWRDRFRLEDVAREYFGASPFSAATRSFLNRGRVFVGKRNEGEVRQAWERMAARGFAIRQTRSLGSYVS